MIKFFILFAIVDVVFFAVIIWFTQKQKAKRRVAFDALAHEFGLTWQDLKKGPQFQSASGKNPYTLNLNLTKKGSAQVVFESLKSPSSFFCLLPRENNGGADMKEAFLESGVGKWLYQKMFGLNEDDLALAKFIELGSPLKNHYVCLANSEAALKNRVDPSLEQFLIQNPTQVISNRNGLKMTLPCPKPEDDLKPILEICRQLSA